MLEELDLLISFIQNKYNEINIQWKNSELYLPLNMKLNTVKDVYHNENILNAIYNYRTFLNGKNLELSLAFKNLQLKSVVNVRVKSQNSVEYKINNYINNHN